LGDYGKRYCSFGEVTGQRKRQRAMQGGRKRTLHTSSMLHVGEKGMRGGGGNQRDGAVKRKTAKWVKGFKTKRGSPEGKESQGGGDISVDAI